MSELAKYQYRERCLRKKGDECVICGEEDVVVHHVDGNRSNNDLTNLIPVCHSHHRKIHVGNESVAPWSKMLDHPSKRSNETAAVMPIPPGVKDETERDIHEIAEERDMSVTAVVRDLIEMGMESEELHTEKQRLQQEGQAISNQSDICEEDDNESEWEQLNRERRERRAAPIWRRAYWYVFGRKDQNIFIILIRWVRENK